MHFFAFISMLSLLDHSFITRNVFSAFVVLQVAEPLLCSFKLVDDLVGKRFILRYHSRRQSAGSLCLACQRLHQFILYLHLTDHQQSLIFQVIFEIEYLPLVNEEQFIQQLLKTLLWKRLYVLIEFETGSLVGCHPVFELICQDFHLLSEVFGFFDCASCLALISVCLGTCKF